MPTREYASPPEPAAPPPPLAASSHLPDAFSRGRRVDTVPPGPGPPPLTCTPAASRQPASPGEGEKQTAAPRKACSAHVTTASPNPRCLPAPCGTRSGPAAGADALAAPHRFAAASGAGRRRPLSLPPPRPLRPPALLPAGFPSAVYPLARGH